MEPVERLLELLRDDLRTGFAQVNARLDVLNGQTRQHGEHIAKLEERTTGFLASDSATDIQLQDLTRDFAAHRARCPFEANPGGSSEFIQSRRKELAVIGTIAAAAAFLATEIGPLIVKMIFHEAP